MRRYQLFALLGGMAAICATMIVATSALRQDSGKPAKLDNDIEYCRSIKDERARIRCYEKKILACLRIHLSNSLLSLEPGSLLARPIRLAGPTRSRSRKLQTQLDQIPTWQD
jgi:hypothetical protein